MIAAAILAVSLVPAPVWVRVEGEGYMRFVREGRTVYAAQAPLVVDGGVLRHQEGYPLVPTVRVSSPVDTLGFLSDGTVQENGREVGRIQLALFTGESPVANAGMLVSPSRPQLGTPGTPGYGRIAIGFATASVETNATRPAEAPTGTLELMSDVMLDKDQITVGDVVKSAGAYASIVLGPMPPHGVERIFDTNFIAARIGQPIQWSGPTQVRIQRLGQQVPPADQQAAAVEAIQAKYPGAQIELITQLTVWNVAPGDLQLQCQGVSGDGRQYSANVVAMVNGQQVASRNIQFKNVTPAITLRNGQQVSVRVTRGSLVIETKGTVRQVHRGTNQVTVLTETGATLTGTVTSDGIVEVKA